MLGVEGSKPSPSLDHFLIEDKQAELILGSFHTRIATHIDALHSPT